MGDKDTKVIKKLKAIRERQDLSLKKTKHLKETFTGFDGTEIPLQLRYYQVQGVLHLACMKRFLLGDDCGLGKTLQSIAAMCFLWESDPTLKVIILTNKSAVSQWKGEFGKFTSGITCFLSKGTPKKREKILQEFQDHSGSPSVLIMGYRSAVRDYGQMQDWENYMVVYDEATAFKNPKTQIHQVCKFLGDRAERVWALTATLIKNNLIEGWGIYRVVKGDLFPPTHNSFIRNYCITRLQKLPRSNRQIMIVVGYRKDDIKRFRDIIDPYFIGRPKFAVASELPTLTTKKIKFEMTKEQRYKYNEALQGLLEVENADGEREEKEVTKLTAIIYCQQIVNHLHLLDSLESDKSAKLENLMDLIQGEFDGEKVIVFSRFRKMIDLIEPKLDKAKIKHCRITGAEDEDQRRASQQKFQDHNSDTNVVLITTAAAEAVNLQSAKAIIFYDSPWSAGDYIQILGRMIRIGSKHDKVFAIHLMAKDSVDERVMQVLNTKMKLIEQVLGKRIKGENEEEVEVASHNDISDLFDSLMSDARNVK